MKNSICVFTHYSMDACCERIFSERGEEGKGGGGGERGRDFTGASLRIADTQGCHNLADRKLEILCSTVFGYVRICL